MRKTDEKNKQASTRLNKSDWLSTTYTNLSCGSKISIALTLGSLYGLPTPK